MIPIEYDEGQNLIRNFECECGGVLSLAWGGAYDIDGYVVICGQDREHTAIRKIRSLTQAYRQGAGAPLVVEDKIERRMMPSGGDINRALSMLAIRYPSAELDKPSASLFLVDCMRLGLDPLLGEAVPIPFFNRKLGKKIVTPIITEDGYLSMAARACPDRWAGPPSVEPITDPALKKEICEDENAWVWKAIGRTKDMEPGQVSTTYGWFKTSERETAQRHGTPAGGLPGNQARVRAIKRWVRENFPEARARMKELTAEWMAQAEGVQEAQAVIEAEYTVFAAEPPAGNDHEEPEKPASSIESPVDSAETSPDTAQAQELVRHHIPEGRPLSEELRQERRAEARASETPETPETPERLLAVWNEIKTALHSLPKGNELQAAQWLAKESGNEISAKIFEKSSPPAGVLVPARLLFELAQSLRQHTPKLG